MPVLESKLVKALKSSDSLRTTVPQSIVTLLGLEAGDTLSWQFDTLTGTVSVAKAGKKEKGKSSKIH